MQSEEATPSATPVLPRLMIAGSRKPVSYLNTAKRLLGEHGRLELCALGTALAPLVTVVEILKAEKLAVEERVETCLETVASGPRQRQKPKLTVILAKSIHYEEASTSEQPGQEDPKKLDDARAESHISVPDGPLMEEKWDELLYESEVDVTADRVDKDDRDYAEHRK